MNNSSKKEFSLTTLNNSTFFKSTTSSVGGDRDDLSISSVSSIVKLRSRFSKGERGPHSEAGESYDVFTVDELNFDIKSQISDGQTWTDLEEMSVTNEQPQKIAPPGPIETQIVPSGNPEDEFIQEPIDFDYLKKITIGNEEKAKSEPSVISAHSKKISKTKPTTKQTFEEIPEADVMSNKTMNKPKLPSKHKNKRRPWLPHEDSKVKKLVEKYGERWRLISSMMEGRTEKQIRERYLNRLKPNIKKTKWTESEDRLILALYYQLGPKWSEIATYLAGRTEGQVKNRFHSHVKVKMIPTDTQTLTTQAQNIALPQFSLLSPTTLKSLDPYESSTVVGGCDESAADPEFDPADMISYGDPKQIEDAYQTQSVSGNDYQSTLDSFESNFSVKEPSRYDKDSDEVTSLLTDYYEKRSYSSNSPKVDHTRALSEISQAKSDHLSDQSRYEELKMKMKYIEMLLSTTRQEIMQTYGKYLPQMK